MSNRSFWVGAQHNAVEGMPAEAWERETGRKGDRVRGDSQREVPGFEPRSLEGGVRGSGWVSAEGLACRLEWGAGVQSRGVSCQALDRCLSQQDRRGAFTAFAAGEGRTYILCSLLRLFLVEEPTRSLPHIPLSFSRTFWKAGPPHPRG